MKFFIGYGFMGLLAWCQSQKANRNVKRFSEYWWLDLEYNAKSTLSGKWEVRQKIINKSFNFLSDIVNCTLYLEKKENHTAFKLQRL